MNESISLHQVVGAVRRRAWVILLSTAIVTGAAVVHALSSPDEYRATATLLVRQADSFSVGGVPNAAQQALSAGTTARLVRSRDVAERVSREMGRTSAGELLGAVETSADVDTGIVSVTAESDRPEEAARIANLFAAEYVDSREAAQDDRVASTVAGLVRELGGLPRAHPQREVIQAELIRLRTLQALPSADAEVVERAVPPGSASEPQPLRDGTLGLALGLVVGFGIALLLEVADRRIRTVSELGRLVSAPQLALLPRSAFRRRRVRGGSEQARALEVDDRHPGPFERLRSSLVFFDRELRLKTLLVASSHEREGKTTVAGNLALAFARTGTRVCVVDADLRQPRLARHLGLDPSLPGLTDVLDGADLDDTLQEVPVPDAPLVASENGAGAGRGPTVSVLPAGRASARPAELLSGRPMEELLDRLAERYDLVLLDAAPLLTHSDAMPLLARVSGTLLVVRFFFTHRDNAQRAARLIERSPGGLLGVVGTGASAAELREEGFGPWPAATGRDVLHVG